MKKLTLVVLTLVVLMAVVGCYGESKPVGEDAENEIDIDDVAEDLALNYLKKLSKKMSDRLAQDKPVRARREIKSKASKFEDEHRDRVEEMSQTAVNHLQKEAVGLMYDMMEKRGWRRVSRRNESRINIDNVITDDFNLPKME